MMYLLIEMIKLLAEVHLVLNSMGIRCLLCDDMHNLKFDENADSPVWPLVYRCPGDALSCVESKINSALALSK